MPASSLSSASSIVPLVERYKAVTTVAEAFTLPEPAIATMCKDSGIEKVQSAFRLQFARFAADLHVKDTLNENDIDFIVEVLTTDENYKWLKLADFAILFKRIRMNRYGKLYQSMNTGTFFECLDKYYIERNAEIERIRTEEAKQHRLNYHERTGEQQLMTSYFIDDEGNIKLKPSKPEEEKVIETPKAKDDRVRSVVNRAKALMMSHPELDYVKAIQQAEEMENA